MQPASGASRAKGRYKSLLVDPVIHSQLSHRAIDENTTIRDLANEILRRGLGAKPQKRAKQSAQSR